ncbi:hypothetical protein MMC17_000907 [Xylographa soralifera]|nr:hypothetical protein [Xylographa soralifera]
MHFSHAVVLAFIAATASAQYGYSDRNYAGIARRYADPAIGDDPPRSSRFGLPPLSPVLPRNARAGVPVRRWAYPGPKGGLPVKGATRKGQKKANNRHKHLGQATLNGAAQGIQGAPAAPPAAPAAAPAAAAPAAAAPAAAAPAAADAAAAPPTDPAAAPAADPGAVPAVDPAAAAPPPSKRWAILEAYSKLMARNAEPEPGNYDEIWERDAEPEFDLEERDAEPEFDLEERDAEPEFDLEERDAEPDFDLEERDFEDELYSFMY